jgi:hypothetical protein
VLRPFTPDSGFFRHLSLVALAFLTASCGGGGGGAAPPVPVPAAPVALSYVSPQVFTVGAAISPLVPKVTGTVTSYSVSPSLPAGLLLNASSGEISGTPTAATAQGSYIVTAQNAGGSASFPLAITTVVTPPSALSYASPQTYMVGVAITLLSPQVTGIVDAYSIAPKLPAGLTFDPVHGQIAGTPTAAAVAGNYTVTAQNAAGSATFVLTITVLPVPPSNLSYSTPQTFLAGTAITALNPTVSGVPAGYSVTPALPTGLAIDAVTGRISGTPQGAFPSATYAITAQNAGGSTMFDLTITVAAVPPSALSYATPIKLGIRAPMTPLNPAVVGTSPTYSVTPTLPAGLALAAGSGQITGTPTAVSAQTNYTITARNSAGSATFVLSIGVYAVTATPSPLSRFVASGTPVTMTAAITPVGFTFPASLTASASDTAGVFASSVAAAASGGGYALSLTSSTRVPPGHYIGNVVVALCADAGCATPQAVPSASIPYDVWVLSATSAWPGNNLSALAPWAGVPNWTMFQGNAAHTGFVPVTIDPNAFSTRWQIPITDIPVNWTDNINSIAESNGLFFMGGGTVLYARNELDGSTVWTYDFSSLPFPSVNPPSVANGVVYVAAGQQTSTYLFAFNAANGSLVFKSTMSSQWEHYLSPTIGPDGIYTNAGSYGGLYGFNTTGQQLFLAPMPQTSQWTPAADATSVYTYTDAGLQVLNPVSGAILTTIADATFQNYTYVINGSAVLGATGSVFAANYENSFLNGGGIGNTLLDFDVTHQSIAWKIAGDYPNTPAYHGGVVYATNNNPVRLEARSETGGALLWSWIPPQAGDISFESETLLTNNMIFVSTNLATYGIDVNTHQTVWSYPLIGKLALSRSGILYIEGHTNSTVSPTVPGVLTAINVK